MSRVTCYLLACTMALTTVMSEPTVGIAVQCQNRHGGIYAGACISQNEFHGELTCLSLACALPQPGRKYFAMPTGPVDDGTLCGLNRVCERGVCVPKKPTDISFPLGNEPKFHCLSPPVAQISGYPPGSNPERNRPAIETRLPHRQPVRVEIPIPRVRPHSRPVASASTSGQRSQPAASSSTSGQRSGAAASTSRGAQSSGSAPSISRGSQASRSAP